MADLNIRGVPETVVLEAKVKAIESGRTLKEFVVDAMVRAIDHVENPRVTKVKVIEPEVWVTDPSATSFPSGVIPVQIVSREQVEEMYPPKTCKHGFKRCAPCGL